MHVRIGPLMAAGLAVLAPSLPAQEKAAQEKAALAKPVKKPSLLAASVARAVKRDLRILVLFGPRKEIVPVERAVNGIKVNGQRFSFEYTVIGAPTDGEGELSRQARALRKSLSIGDEGGAVVAVLDSGKQLLAHRATGAFSTEGKIDRKALGQFLEANRVKMQDAEQVWKDALAKAKADNKNLLLHLAAPW